MFKKIESRTATAGGGVASFFSRKRLVTDPCTHFPVDFLGSISVPAVSVCHELTVNKKTIQSGRF